MMRSKQQKTYFRGGKRRVCYIAEPTSRFYFHETYVFVASKNGVELVNPAFPGLEGRNIRGIKDIKGKYLVQDYINFALEKGEGWVTYYWLKPDAPQKSVEKSTFVKKVKVDGEVMIVGAGMYE